MTNLKTVVLFLFFISAVLFKYFIVLLYFKDMFACFIYRHFYDLEKSYDYIIVGAGSAGSVIAHRLAENEHSILILEAGPHIGSIIDIPALAPLLHKSTVDWQYETVPQQFACFGLKDNKSIWPMGRLVGGTSRLNNMVYARGHESDFYNWYKGVPEFDYERDILAYFKKAEHQRGVYVNDSKYHSAFKGPSLVDDLQFTAITEYVLKAVQSLGYGLQDLNQKSNLGFMKPQMNAMSGGRWTTFDNLKRRNRGNINVQTNSHVNKILFRASYEAYAVNYTYLGSHYVVKALKGIILSAGVIGTPKILMLSGIGDAVHLGNLDIKCKKDLPVGNNLQDHVTTGLDLISLNTSLKLTVESLLSPVAAYNYYFRSKGPWTSGGCDVLGMLNTTNNYPNLGFMVLPIGITSDHGLILRNSIGISDSMWGGYFSNIVGNTTITILPIVLHPKSRGTVRLINSDPVMKPLINPNYLSQQNDVEVLLEGIALIKNIVNTPTMKKLGAKLNNNKVTGCSSHETDTKEYWECYVRHLTITAYHPVGTCKMGGVDDATSVVDYDFQVIGTNKLYVADASVFPTLTSANINAAVVMVAEKAADVIKYHEYLLENVSRAYDLFVKRTVC